MRAARLVIATTVLAWGCGAEAPVMPAPPLPPTAPPGPPQMSEAARAYITSMLDLMEHRSINRHIIDWKSFRDSVVAAAPTASSVKHLFPAIRRALELLGDGHSFYRAASGEVLFVPTRTCTSSAVPFPSLPSSIGYVRVTSFSGSSAQATDFASNLQGVIRARDRAELVGWIVDLRGNGGGNMWPMLAGVGPILGEDTVGYFIDPDGWTNAWEYRGGRATNDGFPLTQVTNPYTLINPRPKVAVLTDNLVASSGEATAIAFRARPNTRTFGMPTCGLSTANATYPLSDGALLLLTVSTMADRTRLKYGSSLQPDELASSHVDAVNRAVAWLSAPP